MTTGAGLPLPRPFLSEVNMTKSSLTKWVRGMNATSAALNPKKRKVKSMTGKKVVILRAGNYSDFSDMPKVRAKHYEAGDVVKFPTEYANSIIASGLAEPFIEPEVEAEPEAVKPKRKRSKK